jgi:hypothetical protein
MSPAFREIQSECLPEWGPDLGVFDARGMLAASYRRHCESYHAWVYNRDDAGIARFLILDTEERARLLCLAVLDERDGWDPPPDLDAMLTQLI